jgi:hypothetical protein
MDEPTFEMKMDRITECAAESNLDTLSRNLLHAYAACLTIEELCEATVRTLDSSLEVRRAMLKRLIRIGRQDDSREHLDKLGLRLLNLPPAHSRKRLLIDAVLSPLYGFFFPSTRQKVLERWRGRGTIGASARWLKAIAGDDLLFELGEVLAYWRVTGDARAAKLLAYRGNADFLTGLLPELIERCDEGWIVSRATLSAGAVYEQCWQAIRRKFPSRYAYLCAKAGRNMGEVEALDLMRAAGDTWPGDERGLAIWALGQLGMWSALEQIRALLPDFRNEELAKIGLSA